MRPVAKTGCSQKVVDELCEKHQDLYTQIKANDSEITAMSTCEVISTGMLVIQSEQILGRGSYGSTVHRGWHNDREVAIKKVPKRVNCLEISGHSHLVYWALITEHSHHYYLVTDLYRCTGEEYIGDPELRAEIGLLASTIVRHMVLGMSYLHSSNIIHRNLNPDNVLFKTDLRRSAGPSSHRFKAMISDLGLSRYAETAGRGYRNSVALEQNGYTAHMALGRGKDFTTMDDIFSLGVLSHEFATLRHPFDGEQVTTPAQRHDNINDYKLIIFGWKPGNSIESHYETLTDIDHLLLFSFVLWMLEERRKHRPTARQLVMGPLFWHEARRLNFLSNTFEYFGHKLGKAGAVRYFDNNIDRRVIKEHSDRTRNWYAQLTVPHREFLEAEKFKDGERKWPYEVESVGHLLRAVRNSEVHLPGVAAFHKQEFYNTHPTRRQPEWEYYDAKELYRAFEKVAPGLLLHVYDIVTSDAAAERALTGYF